jgi:hypothetical protein
MAGDRLLMIHGLFRLDIPIICAFRARGDEATAKRQDKVRAESLIVPVGMSLRIEPERVAIRLASVCVARFPAPA